MKQAAIYGVVVFFAVFFVGWTTGMGGKLVPNIGFSFVMGCFAAALFVFVKKYARRN